MKTVITLFLTIFFMNIFAQDLNCKDFRKGNFFVPVQEISDIIYARDLRTNQLEKFPVHPEDSALHLTIIRTDDEHIEYTTKDKSDPTYHKIKWDSDCSYTLWYDEEKNTVNPEENSVNEFGGLKIVLLWMEENCIMYKSSLIYEEEQMEFFSFGKLCKEL